MSIGKIFSKSIIVAAHPDDEVLWFSSILSKVDKVILCFLAVASKPTWTGGRHKSLNAYPLDNMLCLEIAESEVFEGADWERPVTTDYGLDITQNHLSDKIYRENFYTLKNRLRNHLQGCENVFTHNPWGEYGHVEHVQVYRAVKDLQKEMQFTLWFSNYVSNKSARLMGNAVPGIDTQIRLKTDKPLAKQISSIYKANNCWTWYDDYEWCDDEVFVRDSSTPSNEGRYGSILPLNLIKIGIYHGRHKSLTRLSKIFARLNNRLR